jgi:hypothetical protein
VVKEIENKGGVGGVIGGAVRDGASAAGQVGNAVTNEIANKGGVGGVIGGAVRDGVNAAGQIGNAVVGSGGQIVKDVATTQGAATDLGVARVKGEAARTEAALSEIQKAAAPLVDLGKGIIGSGAGTGAQLGNAASNDARRGADAAASTGQDAANAARDAFNTATNAAGDAANAGANAASDAANAVVNAIQNAPPPPSSPPPWPF